MPSDKINSEWSSTAGAQRLLAFVESLILDVARTNPCTTQSDIALWLARVVVGHSRKARR